MVLLKKILPFFSAVFLAAAGFADVPGGWKLYIPGSYAPDNVKDDVQKAGFTVGPDFSSHFSFADNTVNGKKVLRLDTRDGKSDVLMFPLTGKEKQVTILFKAKGALIPDNGQTPFGILWAAWQRGEYQSLLRHNQSNQIKGSTGQTSLKPDDIVSDWHDFRLVFTCDDDNKSMTARAYIDGKLRHETKKYAKKTADANGPAYDPVSIDGYGNYVLFGENDGSTSGFARYAYILIVPDEDLSDKSLGDISKAVGADLVTLPVTANDPAPKSLRPASKPAGITMTKADGIPVDISGNVTPGDWKDPAPLSDNRLDLDRLPWSKNRVEKVIRNPAKPRVSKKALVVDVSGAGGAFRTVAAAVAAASSKGAVIYIKPGIYREKLVIRKPGIKLVGDDPATTIIYGYEADTGGIDGNVLVEVNLLESADTESGAKDVKPAYAMKHASFSAENITFYNKGAEWNATWKAAERRSIAFALKGVTEAYLKNCLFLGQQDTMYLKSGRACFENCYIEGEVDFICGGATALFDNCHIYSIYYKNGGYITAASPADDALPGKDAVKYANGYVFRNCLVNGDKAVDGKVFLGRGAWTGGSTTVSTGALAKVVYCNCELGNQLDPKNVWQDWDNVYTAAKQFFREYKNTGAGSVAAASDTRQFLTEAEYKDLYADTKKILGFIPQLKY